LEHAVLIKNAQKTCELSGIGKIGEYVKYPIIEYLLENHIFFYALDALCYLDKLEHFFVWRHALAIFQQFQSHMYA